MKNIFKIVSTTFWLLALTTIKAQTNLVPNPSFEIHDSCPDYLSQITRANGWFSARQTPDYFNACSNSTTPVPVSVPQNYFGYRNAASGYAYAGFGAHEQDANFYDREFLEMQLISPLQIGVKYFISYKLSLAASLNPSWNSYCGVNKNGALLSINPYITYPDSVLCNCSQFTSQTIVTDTNWVRVVGSFVSDSTYNYITIGNFYSTQFIDSNLVLGTGCNTYYYLDDVCLSSDSLFTSNYVYTNIDENKKKSTFKIYPNPANESLKIENTDSEIYLVEIYNVFGEIVLKTYDLKNVINLAFLNTGIYFIKAYSQKGPTNLKIQIDH